MSTVMAHMNLVWCLSPNFGDAAGPYLFRKITGIEPTWVNRNGDMAHYVTVGSILNWANAKSTVWGSGLASLKDEVHPECKIASVRGPISRMKALLAGVKCPAVYGDPALLIPNYVNPERGRPEFIGIFPHYVDYWRAREWFGKSPSYAVINPLAPIDEIVRKAAKCKRIVSSALHGLILADSLGIPSAWVRMSDEVGGDGMKYIDHMMSVGRMKPDDIAPTCTDWRTAGRDLNDLPYSCADGKLIEQMKQNLMEVCPFREVPSEADGFRE